MKRLKLLSTTLILGTLLLTNVTSVVAYAIPTVHVGNSSRDVDYKPNKETILDKVKEPNGELDYKELPKNDTVDMGIEYASLRDDNIVVRRESVKHYLNTGFNFKQEEIKGSDTMLLSDFLVALYKASGKLNPDRYGVIEGRPLVADVAERTEKGDIEEGAPRDNKDVYVNSNVYELYYYRLIELGIVDKKDVKNKSMLKDFETMTNSKLPLYYPSLGPYNFYEGETSDINILDSEPLGASYKVTGFNRNDPKKKNSKLIIKPVKPDYMMTEKVLVVDALRYVEKILRQEDDNMLEMEASMINYKLGNTTLQLASEEDRPMLEYLLAKGILNFEKEEELGKLYDTLTYDYACEILNRVYNPKARVDLKKLNLQMTERDMELYRKGYVETELKLKKNSDTHLNEPYDVSIAEEKPVAESSADGLMLGTVLSPLNDPNSSEDSLIQPRIPVGPEELPDPDFGINPDTDTEEEKEDEEDTGIEDEEENESEEEDTEDEEEDEEDKRPTYPESPGTHNNGGLAGSNNNAEGNDKPTSGTVTDENLGEHQENALGKGKHGYKIRFTFPHPEHVTYKGEPLTEVKSGNEVLINSKEKGYQRFELRIVADTPGQAMGIAESRLSFVESSETEELALKGIVKIGLDNGSKSYYVAESELLDKDTGVKILFDKYLRNEKTGERLAILVDGNSAIMGNRIVRTNTPVVLQDEGTREYYYNLEVIAPILEDGFLSKIDPSEIYYKGEEDTQIGPQQDYLEVISPSTGNVLQSVRAEDINGKLYYDINSLTTGKNIITRSFKSKDVNKHETGDQKIDLIFGTDTHVIIEFELAIPDGEGEEAKKLRNALLKEGYDKDTVKEINDMYTTLPKDSKLKRMYEGNQILNDALIRLCIGNNTFKEDITLLKSGFYRAHVYILSGEPKENKEEVFNELLKALILPRDYLTKYAGSKVENLFDKDNGLYNPSNRTLRFLGQETLKKEKKGILFGDLFYLDTTSNIYKNLAQDSAMDYKDGKIYLKRNKPNEAERVVDDSYIIKVGKHKFYNNGTKNGYIQLVSTIPVRAQIKVDTTNKKVDMWVYDGNNKEVDKNPLETIIDDISETMLPGSVKPYNYYKIEEHGGPVKYSKLTDDSKKELEKLGGISKKYDTMIEGKFAKCTLKDDHYEYYGEDVKSKFVTYFPVVYVDQQYYDIVDGTLKENIISNFLTGGTLFETGIMSQLAQELLYKSMGGTPQSNIAETHLATIGDIKFVKKNGYLVSEPITDEEVVHSLKKTDKSKEELQKVVMGLLGTFTLDYKGAPVSLADYVEEVSFGPLSYPFRGEGVLNSVNGTDLVLSDEAGSSSAYANGNGFNSFVFKMKLSDKVGFLPMSETGKEYTLSYFISEIPGDSLNAISIFRENLTLSINGDVTVTIAENVVEPLSEVNELWEKFNIFMGVGRAKENAMRVIGIILFYCIGSLSLLTILATSPLGVKPFFVTLGNALIFRWGERKVDLNAGTVIKHLLVCFILTVLTICATPYIMELIDNILRF